jgi:hypothetical protein
VLMGAPKMAEPMLTERDLQRQRWALTRGPMGLNEPTAEDFGTGGLARFVDDPGVRFLVLPGDPQASLVVFDGPFWEWWEEKRGNPFDGAAPTNWGNRSIPTLDAAALYEPGGDGRWDWHHFLALHRSGALEFVLGSLGVAEWEAGNEGRQDRGFMLVTIVGRVWVALERYAEIVERYRPSGPWELSLGLTRTDGALLGNVAAGWKDFDAWRFGDAPRCAEPNVFIRREVDEWPDADGRKKLAFEIGSMVEDSWGIKDRRFLVGEKHDGAGEFDVSRYPSE